MLDSAAELVEEAKRSAGAADALQAPPSDDDGFLSDHTSTADENVLSVEMEFGQAQLRTATVGDLKDAVESQLEGRSIKWLMYVEAWGCAARREKRVSRTLCRVGGQRLMDATRTLAQVGIGTTAVVEVHNVKGVQVDGIP